MFESETDVDDEHFHLPTSTRSTATTKTTCSICDEEGDGFHFGAESCRACAAFFRRSVAKAKTYYCRVEGKCEIRGGVRCMCRACRFEKCKKVGMNPVGVQQPRETKSKRVSLPNPDSPSDSGMLHDEDLSALMPILGKMRINYEKLDNGRAVIHQKEEDSLFVPKVPRSLTYKESAMVIEKEMGMVVDWISSCFEDFNNLPSEQKRILFRQFLMNFTLLQNAYFCHINNRDDVIIVSSGDFIDLRNLQNFYRDVENLDAPQIKSSEGAVRYFQQSFEMFRKSLILPMMQENIDDYEFLALCTCILWDFGLDGQSDECIEVGRNIKEKVFKELSFYLTTVRKIEEPSIRIAMLVTLLPSLNRSVKKFQEDVEISHVFNIFPVPSQFYHIINGSFI